MDHKKIYERTAMKKILFLIFLLMFGLTACDGFDEAMFQQSDGNPTQENDCLPNESVPCLDQEWSTWYVWLDDYDRNEYVISDGVGVTYEGYLPFEIGLCWRKLGALADDCHHATIYTMGRKIEGTENWHWDDVDGTLSICDDELSISAIFKNGEPATEPK